MAAQGATAGNKTATSNISAKASSVALASRTTFPVANVSSKASLADVVTNFVIKLATSQMSAKSSSAASATVTSGALKTASSQQSGSARMASSATVFFTRIQTCNLSGRASSSASATVMPSLQAQARFGGRASMASSRSIAFIIKAQLQSSARLADASIGPVPDCECPPWQIDPAPPCGWIINTVECADGLALLPFTLPMFRLYDLSELAADGAYHRGDDIACTMSDVQTLANTTTRDATLVNAFGRRGCQ